MPSPYHGREWSVWYVSEGTEGTTPSAASFLSLSQHSEVSIGESPPQVIVPKSGDVDNATIRKAWTFTIIRVRGIPNTSNGKAFFKNFGSSDTSVTLVLKNQDGSPLFHRVVGCKVKRFSKTASIYPTASAVEYDAEIWGWKILNTESGGSPTYESVPNTGLNWSDCAVLISAVTVTNWYSFSWSLENDLEVIPDNTGTVTAIKRGPRQITGQIVRSVTDVSSTEFGEAEAATAKNIRIDEVSDQYLFNNSAWTDVEIQYPLPGMAAKQLSFTAGQYATA